MLRHVAGEQANENVCGIRPGALVRIQLEKVAVFYMEDERHKRLCRKDARHCREWRCKLGIVGSEPRLDGHGFRIV